MNRLKELRNEIGLSLLKLEDKAKINGSNVSMLENGKRPFRQVHLEQLTTFFDVTTDYLLGKSDIGVRVYFPNGDDVVLNDREYHYLIGKITVSLRQIKKENPNDSLPDYVVYREFNEGLNEHDLAAIQQNKLDNLIKRLSGKDIEKIIKFIEDYIL